jgi:hypothetical protein
MSRWTDRFACAGVLLSFALLAVVATRSPADPPAKAAEPDPADGYEAHAMHGFAVMVPKQYIAASPKEVHAALAALDDRIQAAVECIPSDRLRKIQKVTFWVESESPGQLKTQNADLLSGAFYIPRGRSRPDLKFKRGGIQVPAESFLVEPGAKWTTNACPYWALHELAHAYHDQVLGFENEKVAAAFRVAVERKLYDDVYMLYPLNIGRFESRKVKAYARTNEHEYFAELSVAFLAKNMTFPSTREELRDHDARGYALMRDAWER